MTKVLVIGLDCAAPQLVFDEYKKELPNLSKLMSEGVWGEAMSTIPAITVPAWMSMFTSKDPGQLGVYGFRSRKGNSYTEIEIANSLEIEEDIVWEILSDRGKKVCMVGVPPTYPIKREVNGLMVTSFLTPSIESDYTYPEGLKEEIKKVVGEYIIDCKGFRTENKKQLLDQIYEMTEKRFNLVKHFLKTKDWDFFAMVEMGSDRLHHAFWKYSIKDHFKYVPGNEFEDSIKDYYKFLDKKIGELLEVIDGDTAVIVVSDHGAKSMKGVFALNDWLVKEGYLVLKKPVTGLTKLEKADVDWSKTRAWAWGGYYARVFLNVKGREEQGLIPEEDYEKERDLLKEKIKAIKDHEEKEMDNKVYTAEELYSVVNGNPADLMVFLDEMNWRAAGTLGLKALHTFDNDTGPDDAVHAQKGMFILWHPKKRVGKKVEGVHIMDVAPTILSLMGEEIPSDMKGKPVSLETKNKWAFWKK